MKNFIIHQYAKQYQWSGECFLSVKSFYHGSANYRVGHKAYKVDQESFLILNECTHYDLTIDTAHQTESFCVFFSPEFVSGVIAEHASTDRQLLDLNPSKKNGAYFLERKYRHKGWLSHLLVNGKSQVSKSDSILELDEYYHQLLNAVIWQNGGSLLEVDNLTLKKKSTRIEIYQRLQCAKDFIDDNYAEKLSLSEIAMIATLSENHLLRCFKQVFGVSPFKYLSILRIKEAARQIRTTNNTISEIAMAVGYSSMSNFSHYFKSIMGVSPSRYKLGDI